MDYYQEIIRSLVFRGLIKETRLSERQVVMLTWEQVSGQMIQTRYGRSCPISKELSHALEAMREQGGAARRYVFMTTSLPPYLGEAGNASLAKDFRQEEKLAKRQHRKKLRITYA